MDWKKFSDAVPKDKNPVLIYTEGNYYIATYNRIDDTLRTNNNGKNFFERYSNVHWKDLTIPQDVLEEQEKYKKYK